MYRLDYQGSLDEKVVVMIWIPSYMTSCLDLRYTPAD